MDKKCTQCARAVFARGLCQRHYWRQRRHGSFERIRHPRLGACTVEGCEKDVHARGLCSEHYQKDRGYMRATWTSLRSRYPNEYPPGWDSYEEFVAHLNLVLGERPSSKHQLRRPDPTRRWGSGNMVWREPVGIGTRTAEDLAAYQRRWHLRTRYGLTHEEVELIIEAQGGACPICTLPLELRDKNGNLLKVCVDHEHTKDGDPRMRVRGVTHDLCNSGMGLLGDDAANCRRAADHLTAHAERQRLGLSLIDQITANRKGTVHGDH